MRQSADLVKLFETLGSVHFVGVYGSGMAPLACFLAKAGGCISGSDDTRTVPGNLATKMRELGITLAALGECQTVVYSSAIPSNHPELLVAKRKGLRLLHRSELLARVAECYRLIAIAGTHGKSTTSAMLAWIFTELGLEPSFILGAGFRSRMNSLIDPFRVGSSDYLIIEADESDGSFLRYNPEAAILTSIDADHLDFYGTVDALVEAFSRFVVSSSNLKHVIWFGDSDRVSRAVSKNISSLCVSFGAHSNCDYFFSEWEALALSQTFNFVSQHKSIITKLNLRLLGTFNALNAVSCLALCDALGLDIRRASDALASFGGVKRRQEIYLNTPALTIIDDYAHNPVKVASLLQGCRRAFPGSKIITIFQPHRFTRTVSLFHEFAKAFDPVNEVILLPVYSAGESNDTFFDIESLRLSICKESCLETTYSETFNQAKELINLKISHCKNQLNQHCVILTVGAGDVYKIAEDIAAQSF